MNVLTVDVGGTNVKVLATGQKEPRKFPSGPKMTPEQMVSGVKEITGDWKYDVVSIGYPGLVLKGKAAAEPHNLGQAWVDFNFKSAFGCPVKIINDAAMQALGSYKSGLQHPEVYPEPFFPRLVSASPDLEAYGEFLHQRIDIPPRQYPLQ